VSPADRKLRPFLQTAFDERMGQFSPDGRWVAYQSNESGRYEIYVRPFPGPGGQWQVSTNGGIMPRWRRDGKELYYISRDDSLMATPMALSAATLQPGTPVTLFRTRIVGGGVSTDFRHEYDVSADGRFLIVVAADSVASPITLLLNWRAAAR
jgi:Tol biopolymer transport system component